MDVDFREQTAGEADIHRHLAACDESFQPPLSSRVELVAYSGKLASRARTFEAWCGGRLVGLVAAYFNDEKSECFISNVSLLIEFTGRGLAQELTQRCLHRAQQDALRRAVLEVHGANRAAIGLYERSGFSIVQVTGDTLRMRKDLG